MAYRLENEKELERNQKESRKKGDGKPGQLWSLKDR